MGGRLAASPPLAPALALALALALLAAVAPACARLAARESERVGTRLESFELTWRARLREFLEEAEMSGEYEPGATPGAVLEAAARAGHLNEDVLVALGLLEERAVLAAPKECPKFGKFPDKPRICNGPRAGQCKGGKCECFARFTGVACQTEPELEYYDVQTALAEPTDDCKDKVKNLRAGCYY